MSEEKKVQQSDAPSPRRKRRRWPWFILALVILLLLAVMLTPAALGTRPGRALIVSQINSRIPGKISLGGLSLGWFSGMSVSNLTLADEHDAPIAVIQQITTPLTINDILHGRYHLGKTRIIIDQLNLERDASGVTNLQHALSRAKEPSATQSATKKESTFEESAVNRVIDAAGDITIKINQMRWHDTHDTLTIAPIDTRLTFDTGGPPVSVLLNATVQEENIAPGTLKLDGTIDLFHRQRLRPVHEIKIQGAADAGHFELASIKGILTALGAGIMPEGKLDTHLMFDATQNTTVTRGTIMIADFKLSGPALKNETITLNRFELPLDVQIQDGGIKVRRFELAISHAPDADSPTQPDFALNIGRNSVINWSQDESKATITVEYDLDWLAANFKSILPADAVLRGHHVTDMQITGTLTDEPGPRMLRKLQIAPATLGFTRIAFSGVDMGPSTIQFALADGKLTLGPSAIPANQGTLNIAGYVDLNQDVPAYQLDAPFELARNVQINRQIAAGPLAFLPIAWGLDADKQHLLITSGALNMHIDSAHIPLQKDLLAKSGTLSGTLNIQQFSANSPLTQEILTSLGPLFKITQPDWSLREQNIRDVPFSLANGVVHYDRFAVKAGNADLIFSGKVGLDQSLQVTLTVNDGKLNIPVPVGIGGTISKPKINISRNAVEQSAPAVIEKLLDLRKRKDEKKK